MGGISLPLEGNAVGTPVGWLAGSSRVVHVATRVSELAFIDVWGQLVLGAAGCQPVLLRCFRSSWVLV